MVNQAEILDVIEAHPCLTNREIADLLGVDLGNVTGKIYILEKQKVIEKATERATTWRMVGSSAVKTEPFKKDRRFKENKKGPGSVSESLTIDGETRTISEWAKTSGLSPNTVLMRLRRGWDGWDAVTVPNKGRRENTSVSVPFQVIVDQEGVQEGVIDDKARIRSLIEQASRMAHGRPVRIEIKLE